VGANNRVRCARLVFLVKEFVFAGDDGDGAVLTFLILVVSVACANE
jgi:hypothetical protein